MTQHHDPVHPDAGDLDPAEDAGAPEPMAEQDEAFVRSVLTGLPAVPMPDAVVARLSAALAELGPLAPVAEPTGSGAADPGSAADPASTLPVAAATVTTLTPRKPRRSAAGILAAAAGVALVAGGVVIGVQSLRGSPADSGAATAGGAAGLAGQQGSGTSAPKPALLSTSGRAYTTAALASDVRTLVSGGGGSENAPTAAVPDSARALVVQNSRLVSCLAGVEDGGSTVEPVAVDAGTFNGRAAVVIVLPGLDASSFAVYVVAPECSQKDAKVLYYLLVTR